MWQVDQQVVRSQVARQKLKLLRFYFEILIESE